MANCDAMLGEEYMNFWGKADAEISDKDWVTALSKSDLYEDLKHPEEDIYTINDGKIYYDLH